MANSIWIRRDGSSSTKPAFRRRWHVCADAPRGERCRAGVPHDHRKTMTFTGALLLTGMTAPFVYDGAMNGNVFLAYIEHV